MKEQLEYKIEKQKDKKLQLQQKKYDDQIKELKKEIKQLARKNEEVEKDMLYEIT